MLVAHQARNRPHARRAPRWALALLLAAISAMAMLASVAPVASAATHGPICPASGTMRLAAWDRCVWAFHNRISAMYFKNHTTNVNKCAVIKPNSDGSGGNVGGIADCQPLQYDAGVIFASPGVRGYSTGINNSGNLHSGFYGWLYLF